MCHPNWQRKEYFPMSKMNALTGFTGIEIINMLIYRLNGSGLATDAWDSLLSQGKLVYGFGNDDFHEFHDAGRSANIIYVKEAGFNGIKKAVQNGEFIATTGLYLDYLSLENNTITVKAKFPTDTYIDTFTYRFIGENGTVLKTEHCTLATYCLTDEPYVRVEATAENGFMMFTQPVYNECLFKKP